MALSLINSKLLWSQFVHSCVSHPRFPLFDIILQHCYFVKSAVQAKASSQYLRGWRAIRPCPGSLPITQRERGVLLIARDGSFFFFCRMFCQRRYQRSRGLVGMAASWEHISKCYCLWSFSLSLYHFEVISLRSTHNSTTHSFFSLTHLSMEKGQPEQILSSLRAVV